MKVKRTIWIVSLSFILIICLAAGSFISSFEDNKNENRIRDFYLIPQNTLDVVFIGSSSVHTCFYPTVAWESSGITSYCLGMDRCSYITILPMIKEVIRTQNPKLIIVDIDEFTLPDDYMKNEHPIFYCLDSFPWNKTKFETINNDIPLSSRAEYYLPFIRTHSVFSDPKKIKNSLSLVNRYILKNESSVYLKGAELSNIIEDDIEYLIDYRKISNLEPMNTQASKYLNKVLNYCKDCGTEILFIDYPKGRIRDDIEYYSKVFVIPTIQNIIEENGFKVFNYNNLDNPANITVNDFFNFDSHLNIYGCEKFTTYLSEYLVKNYNIKSNHSEDVIAQWNKDAEYVDTLIKKLSEDSDKNVVVNENILKKYMKK